MNFEDLIYQIKEKNSIEEVARDYIELKKSGANFKALCPFHDEKTPSFYIMPGRGFFHCFGCKKSGDVIKFVQEIEHVEFMEAVEILAKRAGINISQYKAYHRDDKTLRIIDANKVAMNFYINRLSYNKNVYKYLEDRGLNNNDIRIFKLGYCDPKYPLSKHIKEKKMNMSIFLDAGIIINKNGEYYDRFWGRLMFPIINHLNNVIGFGGRRLKNNGPKYINSQENAIFKKGNFLYGLYLSRKDIYDKKAVVLVEGYMDFIALYKSGIKNVVAQLGTACTVNQAKLIRRLTEKVILMYDSDSAGINATIRSIPILLKEGINIDIFQYDKYKDPDELSNNIEGFNYDYIKEHSINFIDFINEKYEKNTDDAIIRKKHIISFFIDAVNGINDDAFKDVIIDAINKKLGINRELFKSKSFKEKKRNATIKKTVNVNNTIYYELIGMMLSDNFYIEKICEEIDENEFHDNLTKGLFINICNTFIAKEEINIDKILNNDNIKSLNDYLNERIMYYSGHDKDEKKLAMIIKMIKRENIKRKLEENNSKISITNDEEEKNRLLEINMLLKQKLKKGD